MFSSAMDSSSATLSPRALGMSRGTGHCREAHCPSQSRSNVSSRPHPVTSQRSGSVSLRCPCGGSPRKTMSMLFPSLGPNTEHARSRETTYGVRYASWTSRNPSGGVPAQPAQAIAPTTAHVPRTSRASNTFRTVLRRSCGRAREARQTTAAARHLARSSKARCFYRGAIVGRPCPPPGVTSPPVPRKMESERDRLDACDLRVADRRPSTLGWRFRLQTSPSNTRLFVDMAPGATRAM